MTKPERENRVSNPESEGGGCGGPAPSAESIQIAPHPSRTTSLVMPDSSCSEAWG